MYISNEKIIQSLTKYIAGAVHEIKKKHQTFRQYKTGSQYPLKQRQYYTVKFFTFRLLAKAESFNII